MIFLPAWLEHMTLWWFWLPYLAMVFWFLFGFQAAFKQVQAIALLVSVILMSALWTMNVRLDGGYLDGMSYHLLGVNLISLMIGAPAAFLLGSVLLLVQGMLLMGADYVPIFAFNALCLLLPSCTLNALLRALALRFLPKQLFVYIFVNSFFAGALSMLLTGLLIGGVLQMNEVFSGSVLWKNVFPVFFLLSWGEAFLSGMSSAIFVAFFPACLLTFDDQVYLTRQNEIWK